MGAHIILSCLHLFNKNSPKIRPLLIKVLSSSFVPGNLLYVSDLVANKTKFSLEKKIPGKGNSKVKNPELEISCV